MRKGDIYSNGIAVMRIISEPDELGQVTYRFLTSNETRCVNVDGLTACLEANGYEKIANAYE